MRAHAVEERLYVAIEMPVYHKIFSLMNLRASACKDERHSSGRLPDNYAVSTVTFEKRFHAVITPALGQ